MLPVQQMFGGGAMNPTAGMAMNPLLQGFGSYQNMQDQFTNTQLNQQSQDISNQQQQNVLQQALLDNSNLAQQRQLNSSNMGVQQSMYDNGSQAAAQQAALSQKTQDALSKMSDDKLNVVNNQSAAYVQASEFAKVNPDASMPGSQAHTAMLKILTDADIKDVPSLAGPHEMELIHTRAQAAVPTMAYIRQSQLAQGEQASAERRTNTTAAATVQAAREGGLSNYLGSLLRLPDDARQVSLVRSAISAQTDPKTGEHYVTPDQFFAVEQIMRKNISQTDVAMLQEDYAQDKTNYSGMSYNAVAEKAKALGIAVTTSDGKPLGVPLLATAIATEKRNAALEGLIKQRAQAAIPEPVKNLPAVAPPMPNTSQPTGTQPDVRTSLIPTSNPSPATAPLPTDSRTPEQQLNQATPAAPGASVKTTGDGIPYVDNPPTVSSSKGGSPAPQVISVAPPAKGTSLSDWVSKWDTSKIYKVAGKYFGYSPETHSFDKIPAPK